MATQLTRRPVRLAVHARTSPDQTRCRGLHSSQSLTLVLSFAAVVEPAGPQHQHAGCGQAPPVCLPVCDRLQQGRAPHRRQGAPGAPVALSLALSPLLPSRSCPPPPLSLAPSSRSFPPVMVPCGSQLDYFADAGGCLMDTDGALSMAMTACDAAYYCPNWSVPRVQLPWYGRLCATLTVGLHCAQAHHTALRADQHGAQHGHARARVHAGNLLHGDGDGPCCGRGRHGPHGAAAPQRCQAGRSHALQAGAGRVILRLRALVGPMALLSLVVYGSFDPDQHAGDFLVLSVS